MSAKVFINLPVKNIDESVDFFTSLGYTFNQQFTDETATCMVVSDTIYVMLLTHQKFQEFIPHSISDATKDTEVLICLSCDSREAVKEIIEKAVAAGATTFRDAQDYGFMYGHAFQDLDGHIWEYMWMDPAQIQ